MIYEKQRAQDQSQAEVPIVVGVITDSVKDVEAVRELYGDESRVVISGIHRTYHADEMFDADPSERPDIVVGSGRSKYRPPELPDEPVIVAYPDRKRSKDSGIPFIRARRTALKTQKAIDKKIKRLGL